MFCAASSGARLDSSENTFGCDESFLLLLSLITREASVHEAALFRAGERASEAGHAGEENPRYVGAQNVATSWHGWFVQIFT